MLTLDGLGRRFGDVVAVDGLSLEVAEGELLSLLGPSGCGKTTTLRMIAGFETPTAGRIVLGGRDVTALPPQRRAMGMVFQNYALFPHLDVRENVAFGLRSRGDRGADVERRVAQALETVELAGYAERRVQALSGGQQQRVALARALAPEPPVLLLDEPLSNLDAALRERTRDELRGLLKRLGMTSIFVTHDQEEAFALSDRIAVLERGRLQQVGTPEALYTRPANAFVAGFVGKANFLPATVEGRDGERLACRLAGGALWQARAADGTASAPDARVRVMVRPEALRVVREEEGAGALAGRVLDRRFAGATTVYRVDTGEGEVLAQGGRDDAAAGDAVALLLRRGEEAVAFAPEGGNVTVGGHGGRWALVAGVFVILLWLVLAPNLFVVADSLRGEGGWALAHYARFWGSTSEREALWNSVWISAASVALSALVGVPLAFLFARRDFPGRRLLGALAAMPVLLPPLVGTLSFLFLYGETGFFTQGVRLLFGLEQAPWRLSGAWAVLLVHAYTMYVYFYLFTAAGLSRLDAGYAEAAAALGAGRWTTLRRVTLPLLAPALGGAALLVFMTSMASFSAPYVFGGGFRVLTTQIYASKLNGEEGLVAAEATLLAVASLLFLLLLARLEGDREYTGASKGLGAAPPAPAGRGWLLAAVATLGVGFLLLPHATVLLVSFVPEGTWTTEFFPPEFSVAPYRALLERPERLVPVINSLRMATVATVANVVFAFAAAYLLSRRRFAGRGVASALVALPWALPGTVLAIALARMFSVHEPLAGRFVLVGSAVILPLAYFVRNIPLVTRAALASFRQLDPALEEAAASLGASRARTLGRVVLPQVLPGIAAGAMLAFVAALGEFVASILLYTHRTRPISIEMLSRLRAFDFGGASAYGVLLIVLVAVAFAAGSRRLE